MSSREQFLERIRKALDRPPGDMPSPDRLPGLGAVMPPIAPEELLPKFEAELQKVGGVAHRASDVVSFEEILRSILDGAPAEGVVLSRNPLLAQANVSDRIRGWGKRVASWASGPAEGELDLEFREQAFAAEVGITGVEFVLAETGTLVLTSVTEGSQLASLAPPVHVALYRRNQLVASLEEVLERLPVPRDPAQPVPGRSVVFITGVSRTADIEQILIRGVHGPRGVHAILVEDACLG